MLAEIRQQAGMSQGELSKKLGLPRSYIGRVERGDRMLDVIEFLDIAQALNTDPGDVLKRVK